MINLFFKSSLVLLFFMSFLAFSLNEQPQPQSQFQIYHVCLKTAIKYRHTVYEEMGNIVDKIKNGKELGEILAENQLYDLIMRGMILDTIEDLSIFEDSKIVSETPEGTTVVMKIGESVIKIPKNEMNLVEGTPDSCNQFFETAIVAIEIKKQAVLKYFENFAKVLLQFRQGDIVLDSLKADRESASRSEGQEESVPRSSEGQQDNSLGGNDAFLSPLLQLPSLAGDGINI